jgi:hypothetical protein
MDPSAKPNPSREDYFNENMLPYTNQHLILKTAKQR